jgi:hypothetical protein
MSSKRQVNQLYLVKDTDCKSAGLRLHWFESSSAHHLLIKRLRDEGHVFSGARQIARNCPFLPLNAGFTGNTQATDLMTSKPDFFQNCVIPAFPKKARLSPNPRAAALPKVSLADQILGAPISKARGFRGVEAARFSPRGSSYLAAALGACVSQPSASARHAAH